jgi:hypothetical protein
MLVRQGALLLLAAVLGALLIALAYQAPATHPVDVGSRDAAYAQGFYEPERTTSPGAPAYLDGSDGSARWTRDRSYLVFPQLGLPAQVTLRLRGRPGAPTEVAVLLNDTQELGRVRVGEVWSEHTFSITGGLLKPNDVVIALHTVAAPLSADDPRPVGVLLDRAEYRTGPVPIVPYPAQLGYGALAAGMLLLLLRPHGRAGEHRIGDQLRFTSSPRLLAWLAGTAAVAATFLLLYRLQPPYPYPLRSLLPTVVLGLGGLLALRSGPALAARRPALLDLLAVGGVGVWTGAVLLAARSHLVLSAPGVENDFRVFALRSARLGGVFEPSGVYSAAGDGVLRADGFYNLGYPLCLWALRPLTGDNPFLAGRVVAALSGALLLAATWWLARRLLGRGPALIALLCLALSPLTVQYALYLGTDMPFAALGVLALALVIAGEGRTRNEERGTRNEERPTTNDQRPTTTAPSTSLLTPSRWQVGTGSPSTSFPSTSSGTGTEIGQADQRATTHDPRPTTLAFYLAAGLVAGAAFLMRHPGLLLLPIGWLAIWLQARPGMRGTGVSTDPGQHAKHRARFLAIFTIAFAIAVLPQVIVNLRDTGQPLYNQQAKNVWLAVFGGSDWTRWAEAPNDVSLVQVVAEDPGRFLANWWANLRAYIGAGAEATDERGRAIQLQLLAFPANWLAVAGLLAWLVGLVLSRRGAAAPGVGEPYEPALHLLRSSVSALLFLRSSSDRRDRPDAPALLATLLAWVVLYAVAVSVGLALPRFYLPLAPVYAIAAASGFWILDFGFWLVAWRQATNDERRTTSDEQRMTDDRRRTTDDGRRTTDDGRLPTGYGRALLAGGLILLVLMWGGFVAGAQYVLRERSGDLPGQPAAELAAAHAVLATLGPGDRLAVQPAPDDRDGLALSKYSAIAHLVDADPSRADYLLRPAALGPAPGSVEPVVRTGAYTLYRIAR